MLGPGLRWLTRVWSFRQDAWTRKTCSCVACFLCARAARLQKRLHAIRTWHAWTPSARRKTVGASRVLSAPHALPMPLCPAISRHTEDTQPSWLQGKACPLKARRTVGNAYGYSAAWPARSLRRSWRGAPQAVLDRASESGHPPAPVPRDAISSSGSWVLNMSCTMLCLGLRSLSLAVMARTPFFPHHREGHDDGTSRPHRRRGEGGCRSPHRSRRMAGQAVLTPPAPPRPR